MRGRHGKGPQAAVRWSLATARRAKSTPHGGHGDQLARLGRENDRSTCLRRVSRKAIAGGMEASAATAVLPPGRSRRPGAGRTRITGRDPHLVDALERMIEPHARGGPDAPLCWIGESARTLAAPLTRPGHPISHEKVAQVRRAQDYSGHSTRKTEEGEAHPDRVRAMPFPQGTGDAYARRRDAGRVRRHQAEGVDRTRREGGPEMAACESARHGERVRLPRSICPAGRHGWRL